MDQSYAAIEVQRLRVPRYHSSVPHPADGDGPDRRTPGDQPTANERQESNAFPVRRALLYLNFGIALALLFGNGISRWYGPAIGTLQYATWDRTPAYACFAGVLVLGFAAGFALRDRWSPLLLTLATLPAWMVVSLIGMIRDDLAGWWLLASIHLLEQYVLFLVPAIVVSTWVGCRTRRGLRRSR
jgi:hypothetical protein